MVLSCLRIIKFLFQSLHRNQVYRSQQTAWNRLPFAIIILFIMDIHNIGILINTPGNVAPIHISNTVCGQIGYFHLQCIHARTKILTYQSTIRNCNKRSYRLSVDAYTGTLTNIPEVEHPLFDIGRTLQCKRSGIASSSHHILCTFGRNFRP